MKYESFKIKKKDVKLCQTSQEYCGIKALNTAWKKRRIWPQYRIGLLDAAAASLKEISNNWCTATQSLRSHPLFAGGTPLLFKAPTQHGKIRIQARETPKYCAPVTHMSENQTHITVRTRILRAAERQQLYRMTWTVLQHCTFHILT